MILVVCIANNNGIMFNKRRVSKDALLIERLKSKIGENKIYLSNYSKELFYDFNNITHNIEDIKETDFYFLEDEKIPNLKINEIIVYKWNRDYPADKFWELSLNEYKLISEEDFAGNSHERITEIIYTKEN